MKKTVIISIIVLCVVKTLSQNNGNTLSKFIKECYSDPSLLDRNNIPPMTLSVLLDIIRKVEDYPNVIGDMRQISTGLVHLFRQDGIEYDPTATGTQYIIPYGPTGFPTYKHRLLMSKLIPNNQFNLPTDVLTPEEKCALHHMISSSIFLHARGDEEWSCSNLSTNNDRNARLVNYKKSDDIELFDVNGIRDKLGKQIIGFSRCPMETGVVSTAWGDVSMGAIVTGIASGLEEQNVLVSDLVILKSGFNNNSIIVNNRYASTISGDIAEAAIRQGMTRNVITVGATGSWNNTYLKKHYFHSRTTDLELTDGEIRGGLDGVILSELVSSYVSKFPDFKLSQLIDMYYSNNGLFHETRFRACNRRTLVPDVASTSILTEQSLGTAIALYHVSRLSGTTNLRGIQTFVNNTVAAFHSYIPQHINDPACNISPDQVLRPKLNLILITDISRNLNLISYIVDNIEVSKYGSSITLLHPVNGDIVINKTNSVATFYQKLAKYTINQPVSGELNVVKVLESLQEQMVHELELEKVQHYSGGNATVALFLFNMIPMTRDEQLQAMRTSNWLRSNAPDLRLIFASTPGSETMVLPLLRNPNDFIPITISVGRTAPETVSSLVQKLATAPRRIINPVCGSSWDNNDSGITGFEDFVDASGINLYRIIPNYFYINNPLRILRIQSTDYGTISVCYSRSNEFPRRNKTTSAVPGDAICESVTNSGLVEISLMEACNGETSIENCPPLYLTVSSTTVPIIPQCKDWGCRYPNDVKYLIAAHELGCYSSTISLKSSLIFFSCFMFTHIWIAHFKI